MNMNNTLNTVDPASFIDYDDLSIMNHKIIDGIIYYDGSTKKQNEVFEEMIEHHKKIIKKKNFKFFSMPKPTTLTLLSKLSDIIIKREETDSILSDISKNAVLISNIFPMVRTIMTNKKRIDLLPSFNKKKRKKRILYKVNFTKRKEKDGELFSTQISLKLCNPNNETRKKDIIISKIRSITQKIDVETETGICDMINSWVYSDEEREQIPKQKYYYIKLFYNGTIHIPGVLREDFSDVTDIIKCFCVFLRFITKQNKIQLAYFKPCMRNYISNNVMTNPTRCHKTDNPKGCHNTTPKKRTSKSRRNIKTNKFLNTLKFKQFLLSKVTCKCTMNTDPTEKKETTDKKAIIGQYNEMRRNVNLYSCHLKLEDTNEMVLKFDNIHNNKDKFSIAKISNKKITFNGLTSDKEIYMIYYWLQTLISEFLENKNKIEEMLRSKLDKLRVMTNDSSKKNLHYYFGKKNKNENEPTQTIFHDFCDVAHFIGFKDVDHLKYFMIDNGYQDIITWPNLLYV